MRTTLRVHANSDDVLLTWTVDELDPACTGFGLQRRLDGETRWLDNFAPRRLSHQSSRAWPFRRFDWTDHTPGAGDVVSYRVVPVCRGAPQEALATPWSAERRLTPPGERPYAPVFNRGFVISQFVSRYLDEHFPGVSRPVALERFKEELGSDLEDRLRAFLAGEVRTTLLGLLADVQELHAALYELEDEELVRALEALGPRAHVVLANGSVAPRPGETSAEARRRDQNAGARARLIAAGVDVEAGNRFVSPGSLAHNKFAVGGDADGTPRWVWTGSTNWTVTGLCTQLNNGLLVRDEAVAALYREQWDALRRAGSGHPASLTAANARPGVAGDASVRFTRAPRRADLDELRAIVSGAQDGVLFLMFIPGTSGVIADVRALAASRPDLVVRGVVSELPRPDAVRVRLLGEPAATPSATFEAVQPEGRADGVGGWAVETTHRQFTGHVGYAIIHSKVLVVDPYGAEPVVVTGSHNFSISASEDNDENFIVVRGDRALAEAYAVNVEAAYRHYAARLPGPEDALSGTAYLQALLDRRRHDERFWGLDAPTGRFARTRPAVPA